MRSAALLLALSTSCPALATPAAGAAPAFRPLTERHRFDVPAQDMNSALLALSQQSSVRILFPYDEVNGYRARAIRGWLTTEQALDRLIAGTPLRRSMAGERTIAIVSSDRRQASARNAQRIELADRSADLRTLLAGSAAAAMQVAAPDPVPPAEIIVTGTRTTNRTVADSLAPIDVLGKADLQTSGKQSVRDLLGTLVPSISVSNSGAGASFAVKTLSLRGLAGDQLLVLVNGKRRHNTATLFINGTTQNGQSPPDLDLIPSNAIERIEVLRDGASAQYGSDAIAGVVNIILKDDASGGASMLLGANGDGGGETGRAQFDQGLEFGDGGSFHVAGDAYTQGRTVRGTANTSLLYPLVNGQRDPREASANRYVNKPGQPQVVGYNGSYQFSMPLSVQAELYSFGTASTRHADAWLTYRNPNASNNILAIYPDGYVPHLHTYDKDLQGAVGVRGELGTGFRYDLSTTYGQNRVDYRETTALNASLGPASPTSFYIGYVKSTEWTTNLDLSKQLAVGLVEPLLVAAGAEYRRNSYTIGAGEPASYIDGGYRSPPGQLFAGVARVSGSQGVTGFPTGSAGTWKRNNWSAYLNLEQTVVDGFEVALAGRHEDYSDFGTTDTGKVSARLEPVRGFAIRGTASTGFRAPTLQQQHYASSSTIGVTVNGVSTLLPVRALPVDSPAAIALGAEPLKPEKSTNYSVGVVLTPVPRLNITVDAYQIDIKDRILLSGTLSGAAVNAALAAAGITSSVAGFYFSNAADTRTRGLDVVGTYRAGLGDWGDATVSLSANFNKTKFTHIDQPPAALAAAGLVLIDRARQGDFTRGTPRDKFIANVNWVNGPASINLRATRYGKVTQVSIVPANDDTIEPKVIFDLETSYEVQDGVKLSVGANNLFNIYPTVLKPANQGTTGFSYYNPYSPYGISGGFYYGRLTFSF